MSLIVTTLASLVAAGAPLWQAQHAQWTGTWFAFAVSYSLILATAGSLMFFRSIGAQLFARSVWWSAFGIGVLVAVFAAEQRDAGVALAIVLATSASLVAAGRTGLDHDSAGAFAPAAYRGPIMVSMIMALADAQALGWLGAFRLYIAAHDRFAPIESTEVRQAGAMLVCSAVALLALYGLYKLRLWGLVLSAVTTLAVGVLAWTPALGLHDAGPLPYAFSASAVIQIALLAPLLAAIVSRRAPPPASPRRARIAAVVPSVVVIALAALAIVTVATSHSLVKF